MLKNYQNKSVLIFISKSNFSYSEFLNIKKNLEHSGFKIFISSDAISLSVSDNGQKVRHDVNIFNINPINFSSILIIGGYGILEYRNNISLKLALEKFLNSQKIIGGICAAPLVISELINLTGFSAVCYKEFKDKLVSNGVNYVNKNVVIDRNLVTAIDSNAAEEFCEILKGKINESI